MEERLQHRLGPVIQLTTRLAPELWSVEMDPAQVEQTLFELADFARDDAPDGGRVSVATANAASDNKRLADHPEMRPGDYVLVTVSGLGGTLSQEEQSRIFEPFYFTSIAVADGVGLRLAAVYGIVKQNGGYVWLESQEGQEPRFEIYLPRFTEAG